MEYDKFERTINQMEGASRPTSLALPSLMRKVYLWMTLALVITGLTSYEVATSQTIIYTLYSNQAYLWGIVIAELALVMIISAAINRLSLLTATLLFILYSALNGVMCSSILILYTAQSVASTFFIFKAPSPYPFKPRSWSGTKPLIKCKGSFSNPTSARDPPAAVMMLLSR